MSSEDPYSANHRLYLQISLLLKSYYFFSYILLTLFLLLWKRKQWYYWPQKVVMRIKWPCRWQIGWLTVGVQCMSASLNQMAAERQNLDLGLKMHDAWRDGGEKWRYSRCTEDLSTAFPAHFPPVWGLWGGKCLVLADCIFESVMCLMEVVEHYLSYFQNGVLI